MGIFDKFRKSDSMPSHENSNKEEMRFSIETDTRSYRYIVRNNRIICDTCGKAQHPDETTRSFRREIDFLRETQYKGVFECSVLGRTYYIGIDQKKLRSDKEYIHYVCNMIMSRSYRIIPETAQEPETGFYLGTVVETPNGLGYELNPEICEFAKKQPEYIEYKKSIEQGRQEVQESIKKTEEMQRRKLAQAEIDRLFKETESRHRQVAELREQIAQYEQQIAQETDTEKLEDLKHEVYGLNKKLKPLENDEIIYSQILRLIAPKINLDLNGLSFDNGEEHTEGKNPKM